MNFGLNSIFSVVNIKKTAKRISRNRSHINTIRTICDYKGPQWEQNKSRDITAHTTKQLIVLILYKVICLEKKSVFFTINAAFWIPIEFN